MVQESLVEIFGMGRTISVISVAFEEYMVNAHILEVSQHRVVLHDSSNKRVLIFQELPARQGY